jgi:hypothetical protein
MVLESNGYGVREQRSWRRPFMAGATCPCFVFACERVCVLHIFMRVCICVCACWIEEKVKFNVSVIVTRCVWLLCHARGSKQVYAMGGVEAYGV